MKRFTTDVNKLLHLKIALPDEIIALSKHVSGAKSLLLKL